MRKTTICPCLEGKDDVILQIETSDEITYSVISFVEFGEVNDFEWKDDFTV